MKRFALAALAIFLLPSLAFASTTTDVVTQLAGLFYVIVGLALTASILLMGAGIILWLARLGTDETYRDTAINLMEWGVATLFTLILVLAVVEFAQSHTAVVLYIIGILIILLVIWFVLSSLESGGGDDDEDE